MRKLIESVRHFRQARNGPPDMGFIFERPLVLFQSDDWGRVGVRDAQGFAELRATGLALGESPYDYYTLETAEDVTAMHGLLSRHVDSSGRSPQLTMNFIVANLDFQKSLAAGSCQFQPLPVLPGEWARPGLWEALLEGIRNQVFYPALHGMSHFCQNAMNRELLSGERSELIRTLWRAETPYIHWRMPRIGFEYWSPDAGFLSANEQKCLVRKACETFHTLFGRAASSACAPGYRANEDTHRAWADLGIRTAQNGSECWRRPYIDPYGILHLSRILDFEPAVHTNFSLRQMLETAEKCFSRGLPLVVSVHSINFHSTVRNFRDETLRLFDEFLLALEKTHPNLLYVNDADMLALVEKGTYEGRAGRLHVQVKKCDPQLPVGGCA
jgi:hypothetical protein